jgi:hypothetical protein
MENRCCGVGVEVGHVNHGLLVVEHVVLVGVLESGCGKRPNEEDVKRRRRVVSSRGGGVGRWLLCYPTVVHPATTMQSNVAGLGDQFFRLIRLIRGVMVFGGLLSQSSEAFYQA